MALSTQQKLNSMEKDIAGLQDAIRRMFQEQEQSLAILSKVKETTDIMHRRVESLEHKASKDAVGAKELY